MFQHVQHLDDMDTTGTGRRHGDDLVAAVLAGNRLAFHHFVIGQILFADQALVLAHFLHDLIGNGALVKGIAALLGDHFHGGSQVFHD